MFLLIWGHQHGVSMESSLDMVETFLRIKRVWKTVRPSSWRDCFYIYIPDSWLYLLNGYDVYSIIQADVHIWSAETIKQTRLHECTTQTQRSLGKCGKGSQFNLLGRDGEFLQEWTISMISHNINNCSQFSFKLEKIKGKKKHLHGSIYHSEFSKYTRSHKDTLQTYKNMRAQTCQFLQQNYATGQAEH